MRPPRPIRPALRAFSHTHSSSIAQAMPRPHLPQREERGEAEDKRADAKNGAARTRTRKDRNGPNEIRMRFQAQAKRARKPIHALLPETSKAIVQAKRRFFGQQSEFWHKSAAFFGPLRMLRRKTPGRQTPHWKPDCQIVPELGLLAKKRRFANMARRTHPPNPNPSAARAPPAPPPLRPQAFRARPPAERPAPARSRNPSCSHIPS